jgi:hypothetical protein
MTGEHGQDGYGPQWNGPRAPYPAIVQRYSAAMPDLSGGNCAPGRSKLDAEAWDMGASDELAEAARYLCHACPVLAACRAWAAAPDSGAPKGGIVAGLNGPERSLARGEAASLAEAERAARIAEQRERSRGRERERAREHYHKLREAS